MVILRLWICVWFAVVTHNIAADSANSTQDRIPSPSLHSLSEVVQVISAAHEWNVEEVRVSSMDSNNAKIGNIQSFEVDIQAGDNVFPARFVDEITSWSYLEDKAGLVHDESLLQSYANLEAAAVLQPFQVEGPLELWIHDADQLQLIMPDGTNIGGFKHLVLAEGTTVTVEGAREVILDQPVDIPSSLNTSFLVHGPGRSLRALSLSLRYAAELGKRSLALRIVSPTLMVATSLGNQETGESNIEANFVGPDTIQLSTNRFVNNSPSPVVQLHDQQMRPLQSSNTSDAKALLLEKLLITFLGNRAYREDSLRILKASVSASAFVQIRLELEKKLSNESFDSGLWPTWRTRPTMQRLSVQVLARVEGNRLRPLVIKRLKPFIKVVTHSWSDLMSNVSFTSFPSILIPSSPLTLDVQW